MLGLLLHLAMACLIALIFFLAARNFAPIRTHFVVFGLAYGALVYFVMRWIVVPLSRFPGDLRVINPLEILVHMVGVGMVIAIFVRGEFAASGNFDPATAEAAWSARNDAAG